MANTKEQLQRGIARRQAEIDRLADELDRIASMGEEPDVDTVLSFTKSFGGGQSFTYAALRTAAGWFLTGRSGGRYSWEELVAFIAQRETELPVVYFATGWDVLA